MTDNPRPPIIIKVFPDANEREMIEFFYELGNSVNRSAYVDRQLYGLCRFALQMDTRQAAILYYRQNAFNNRLRLVSDALKSLISKDQFIAEWKPIFDRIEDLAETRNIFVHHPAKRLGASDGSKPVYTYAIHIEPTARLLNRDYPGLRGKAELGIEGLRQQ